MKGFFVDGSSLVIQDQAHPNVTIRVLLHQCIIGSGPFFHSVWDAVWALVGKMAANGEEYQLPPREAYRNHNSHHESLPGGHQEDGALARGHPLRFPLELAEALKSLPDALMACNLNKKTQQMFGKAIKT